MWLHGLSFAHPTFMWRCEAVQDSVQYLSRRKFLEIGSAVASVSALGGLAAAQQVSGPDHSMTQTPEHPAKNETDPGPQNKTLDEQNGDSVWPPESDNSDMPTFKFPFSFAHKRIERGGWTRQVTEKDFPISTTIAGVDMRLTAGGVRELHWHKAAEWAFMLYGNARITGVDLDGRGRVADITAGDLWYFPTGVPHSIQGLEPDGCEFLLVFDDGKFSEYETFLITDWMHHTPPEVLAKNFGVDASAFARVPSKELYIFQAPLPNSFEDDQRVAAGKLGLTPRRFDFKLTEMKPTKTTKGGEVHIVDSAIFPVSKTIAMAKVMVHPGGVRELHWHPNADEWQYYIQGQGRMTVFAAGAKARTLDFQAGDIGYVEITKPHYIENTGNEDLVFLEMFKSDRYQDLSLSQWISHTPPELVKAHLNVDDATLKAIPDHKVVVMPEG
jgi:oxalate decarboxylase